MAAKRKPKTKAKSREFVPMSNRQLKMERRQRGISRRQLERERYFARVANPKLARPQFWWVNKK